MIDVDIFMVDNWLINPLLVVDLPRKNSDQKVGMGPWVNKNVSCTLEANYITEKSIGCFFLVIYRAASTTIDESTSGCPQLPGLIPLHAPGTWLKPPYGPPKNGALGHVWKMIF